MKNLCVVSSEAFEEQQIETFKDTISRKRLGIFIIAISTDHLNRCKDTFKGMLAL